MLTILDDVEITVAMLLLLLGLFTSLTGREMRLGELFHRQSPRWTRGRQGQIALRMLFLLVSAILLWDAVMRIKGRP
jgi:hypothetical protein